MKNVISIIILLMCIILPHDAYSQLDSTERTHFIVLIRDTGLMKKGHKAHDMIVPTLPKLLFQGNMAIGKGTSLSPPLPIYQPKRDHLSVMFAGIHSDKESASQCKTHPALSVLPKHFFQWQEVTQGQNQKELTQSLKKWMQLKCRAQANVSSSVLTETMSLPYVHSKLAQEGYQDLKFSRTILIILSNDAYYGGAPPNQELFLLNREHNVKDVNTAARSIEAVNSAFHIVTPRDWIFTINPKKPYKFESGNTRTSYTLKYRLAEVHPLDTNVDNYIDYTRDIHLDRIATANNTVTLIEQQGKEIGLRLLYSDRLRPEKIEMTFTNQTGGVLQLSQHRLPVSLTIDIADCLKSKKCDTRENGVIYIPILSDLTLSLDNSTLMAGHIRFKVRFRYKANNVYDHHYVDTDWKTIQMTPMKASVILKNWLFPKIILDNKTLTEQYNPLKDSKTGLTQDTAKARIVATRKMYEMTLFGFLVGFLVVIAFVWLYKILHARAYNRRFKPVLEWNHAKQIDIDFNQTPGSRLLVGILNFKNEGHIPWFGRFQGNTVYPDYELAFSLDYDNQQLIDKGFSLTVKDDVSDDITEAFGFREAGEGTSLKRKILYRVNHKTPIYVFLATDAIRDFKDKTVVSGTRTLTFGGAEDHFQMSVKMSRFNKQLITKIIHFQLELIPESSKPPVVTYQKSKETLYYNNKQPVTIGTFIFKSQVQHYFAYPFKEDFNVRGYQEGLPVSDDTIKLINKTVTIDSFQAPSHNISVLCDGKIIPNPKPPSQEYTFNLLGEFAAGSQHNNHSFDLRRDPTRANIKLDILQTGINHRIYWTETAQQPFSKTVIHGKAKHEEVALTDNILELAPYFVNFDAKTPKNTIFQIHIGNTGKVGKGKVSVKITPRIKFQSFIKHNLKITSGYTLDDLLVPIVKKVVVTEGAQTEILLIQIDAATIIKEIVGGRVKGGIIEVTLDIDICDDTCILQKKSPHHHQVHIHAPIGLEKLPHPNWLCIDFGTSAIVAAIGSGTQTPYILPLQKLDNNNNEHVNLSDYDLANSEMGSEFLPSTVMCNADLRSQTKKSDAIRKGYPSYQPASLKPGDPDFVTLPATSGSIRDNPGRVIISLKSWLAQPTNEIFLQERITFQQDDKVVTRNKLPLEKMLQSAFAALAEAYITGFNVFQKGGQVILSHPNTFTEFHKRKLHNIAWRALNQPLGIALEERIHLISESDAVAYHYCQQRITDNKQKAGWERLLVYDFGAGTLDLSLIRIKWNQAGVYPEEWRVENRIGVPIAGNHLDRLLARLVDHYLIDKTVLDPKIFQYVYPVVEQMDYTPENKEELRLATSRLWHNIRYTKHHWDGQKPFCVKIGAPGTVELVNYLQGKIKKGNDTSTYIKDDCKDSLCIPSKMVHEYPVLKEFVTFVTDTMIDELLEGAGVTSQDVNTVIISGRGALWPGLRERVWSKFPQTCDKPKLQKAHDLKSAVVSGAIAWQNLSQVQEEHDIKKTRLAILCENTHVLIPEEEWGKKGGIDLRGDNTFCLVQVAHHNPNPKKDLTSLHSYFYIRLEQYYRHLKWKEHPYLFASRNGNIIRLENDQHDGFDFTDLGMSSHLTAIPAWPIGGNGVLPKQELYH